MRNTKSTNIKEILASLTLDEKIRLLNGRGSWYTYGANGKVPEIMMTDGPHGLRKQPNEFDIDINNSKKSTCFPTASCVASSWSRETVEKMADAIADQALAEEVSMVLGCGMNIKRSPMCGRNFEYFSEDPMHAGSMAAGYIDAMQKKGVGTSIKHFLCNNQETRRQSSDSIVDERALREIYLRPFEIAVRNSQPTTIMVSYNKVNGTYSCANEHIIQDVLRKEWGFKGTTISDWGAAVGIADCIKAGLNLDMPDSSGYHQEEIKKALEAGTLTEADLDKAAEKVIELVVNLAAKKKKVKADYKKAHQVAKEIACESAVLLKNDGILPLDKTVNKEIFVIGDMAQNVRIQGGGSSHINPYDGLNVIDALRAKGFNVRFAKAYPSDEERFFMPEEKANKLLDEAVELARTASLKNAPCLLFCGLTNSTEGEGFDRHDMKLPEEQTKAIKKLLKANNKMIAVTYGGSPFEINFKDDVRAILMMYLAGEASGEACAELLTGAVNPSGKLAETFPVNADSTPCKNCWGMAKPSIEYRESIFTGYRYYETFNVPVNYEFGFGLSYTTFKYSGLTLSGTAFDATECNGATGTIFDSLAGGSPLKKRNSIKVKFTVKNTGKRAGSEIVQVYVKNPKCSYLRPVKELRGFTKVYLEPGKSKKVQIELDARAFSIYDESRGEFVAPTGTYEIQVGASIKDIKLTKTIKVKGVKVNLADKETLPSYCVPADGKVDVDTLFKKKDFVKLYGKDLPVDPSPVKGTYTMFNNLAEAMELSPLCKKIVNSIINRIYKENQKAGRSIEDPAVKIGVMGILENPIESLILIGGGQFKASQGRAIVNLVNGKKWTALKELLSRK